MICPYCKSPDHSTLRIQKVGYTDIEINRLRLCLCCGEKIITTETVIQDWKIKELTERRTTP